MKCEKCNGINITILEHSDDWSEQHFQEADMADCLHQTLFICACGHYWWSYTDKKPDMSFDNNLCPRCLTNVKNESNYEHLCDECQKVVNLIKKELKK